MIDVGVKVRVKAPFSHFFPDEYVVEGQNAETGAWQIAGGVDFDASYLEVVE